jgi:methylated-DNA-protein-cysteine methyltransferase-like protein
MAGSPFFARIKADVLAIAEAVPAGRLTTYGDVARHLAVSPRQVAYILATLHEVESEFAAWHRVVSAEGVFKAPSGFARAEWRRRMREEGVTLEREAEAVVDFPAHRIEVATIAPMPPQTRPADAPPAKARRRRA